MRYEIEREIGCLTSLILLLCKSWCESVYMFNPFDSPYMFITFDSPLCIILMGVRVCLTIIIIMHITSRAQYS